MRDAYYCGAKYGEAVNIERILDVLTLMEVQEADGKKIVLGIEKKGLTEAGVHMTARESMYSGVYRNKTISIAEAMFLRALHAVKEDVMDGFPLLTDYELLTKLDQIYNGGAHPLSRELYERVMERDLYKQAFCIPTADFRYNSGRENLLKSIRDGLLVLDCAVIEQEVLTRSRSLGANIQDHEVIVKKPNKHDLSERKEQKVYVRDEGLVTISHGDRSLYFMESMFSVYTPAEHRDVVGRAAKKYVEEVVGQRVGSLVA